MSELAIKPREGYFNTYLSVSLTALALYGLSLIRGGTPVQASTQHNVLQPTQILKGYSKECQRIVSGELNADQKVAQEDRRPLAKAQSADTKCEKTNWSYWENIPWHFDQSLNTKNIDIARKEAGSYAIYKQSDCDDESFALSEAQDSFDVDEGWIQSTEYLISQMDKKANISVVDQAEGNTGYMLGDPNFSGSPAHIYDFWGNPAPLFKACGVANKIIDNGV